MFTYSFVHRNIALILSVSLLMPMIAFAQVDQTAPSSAPVENAAPTVPSDSAAPEVPMVVDTPVETPAVDSVQDTAPTQEAVMGAVLEGTQNPEVATSTDTEIIPIVDATTTEPVVAEIPMIDTLVETVPQDIPVEPSPELTIVADSLTPVVETIAEDFVPLKNSNDVLDPDYTIGLSGKTIPTTKQGTLGKSSVSSAANVVVNSADDSISVSGSCSNVYFVVLLFRNQTDYDADPASYIVNRAYPCVGGLYSYVLNDLPTTIQNGTYYLLIGEQGDRGSWSPITALTEVSINRSN